MGCAQSDEDSTSDFLSGIRQLRQNRTTDGVVPRDIRNETILGASTSDWLTTVPKEQKAVNPLTTNSRGGTGAATGNNDKCATSMTGIVRRPSAKEVRLAVKKLQVAKKSIGTDIDDDETNRSKAVSNSLPGSSSLFADLKEKYTSAASSTSNTGEGVTNMNLFGDKKTVNVVPPSTASQTSINSGAKDPAYFYVQTSRGKRKRRLRKTFTTKTLSTFSGFFTELFPVESIQMQMSLALRHDLEESYWQPCSIRSSRRLCLLSHTAEQRRRADVPTNAAGKLSSVPAPLTFTRKRDSGEGPLGSNVAHDAFGSLSNSSAVSHSPIRQSQFVSIRGPRRVYEGCSSSSDDEDLIQEVLREAQETNGQRRKQGGPSESLGTVEGAKVREAKNRIKARGWERLVTAVSCSRGIFPRTALSLDPEKRFQIIWWLRHNQATRKNRSLVTSECLAHRNADEVAHEIEFESQYTQFLPPFSVKDSECDEKMAPGELSDVSLLSLPSEDEGMNCAAMVMEDQFDALLFAAT